MITSLFFLVIITPQNLLSPKKMGEAQALFMHLGNDQAKIEDILSNILSLKVEIPGLELPAYLTDIPSDGFKMWTEANIKDLDQRASDYAKSVAQLVNKINDL